MSLTPDMTVDCESFPITDDISRGERWAAMKVLEAREPLLLTPQRLTVYPLAFPEIWQAYKRQLACFWTADEIDFSKDRDQWNRKLTDDERKFVRGILAFFAGSDSVVSLNLMNSFCSDVSILEAQVAYTYQAAMENIHGEVYSIMIDVYIQDPDDKALMFDELGGLVSVQEKVKWAQKWGCSTAPFAHRLVAFAIVEGLFFSGAFCAIYWLKQRNLLPGLTKSNEFIARDEGQHTDFACMLYAMLKHTRLPEAEVHAMFRDAVAVEKRFINECVPCRLVGMNPSLMSTYIEHVADALLVRLGYNVMYRSANPFSFMELMGMEGRSNFFEERVSLYQRAESGAAVGGIGAVLYLDDF